MMVKVTVMMTVITMVMISGDDGDDDVTMGMVIWVMIEEEGRKSLRDIDTR